MSRQKDWKHHILQVSGAEFFLQLAGCEFDLSDRSEIKFFYRRVLVGVADYEKDPPNFFIDERIYDKNYRTALEL